MKTNDLFLSALRALATPIGQTAPLDSGALLGASDGAISDRARDHLLPQDIPSDIGPQLLARHGAPGVPLDLGTVLGRDSAARLPHARSTGGDVDC